MKPTRIQEAPPEEALARVRELGHAGLTLQAYQAALEHAPLRVWAGVEGRLVAAHLAHEVGAPVLGTALIRLAWRNAPGDARLLSQRAQDLIGRGRLLAAFELLESTEGQSFTQTEDKAQLLTIRSLVLAQFRDFERAHRCLEEASHLFSPDPRQALARANVLVAEDRYVEAADEVRRLLDAHPTMIPAIAFHAHLLQVQGHDEAALHLLEEATTRLESGSLVFQLAGIYSERGDFKALEQALNRYEMLSPLLEKQIRHMLIALRADLAYAQGDFHSVVKLGEASRSPFHVALAKRLETVPSDRKRVLLPIGFVRQHFMTCVPATLSTITQYWGRPAEHLKIAEEICYAGTTSQAERAWAESNGWTPREFTVTWEAARALLDRGIPFTLTTRIGDVGHLQAVIGYDSVRGTLFLRDPNVRHHREAIAHLLFEDQAPSGPRGMAIVPADRADLLEPLDLPDATLYDDYFRFESALRRYDREQALIDLKSIEVSAPNHRLAILAQYSLSVFDGDPARRQVALVRWLERFPTDIAMRLSHLENLNALGRRAEMGAELAELCAAPAVHPVLFISYGRFLAEDVRDQKKARRWIHLALLFQPDNSRAYEALGEVEYRTHGALRALKYYRLAASLSDKDEGMAMAYFNCARAAGRQEEALAFLEDRWHRLCRKSPWPGISLATAFLNLELEQRAFELLESALALHPEDGQLMLILAQTLQSRGRSEAADLLLDQARGRCSDASHWVACARIAMQQGNPARAREAWEAVVLGEPLSLEGHHALAQLDCSQRGPAAALQRLAQITGDAPHHMGLRRLELEWVLRFRPDQYESKARALVEMNPRDADIRVHWCSAFAREARTAEAIEQARIALEIAPRYPLAAVWLGRLAARAGRDDDARKILRDALRISVDLPDAVQELAFSLSETEAERRSVLSDLAEALRHLPSTGDGLRALAFVGEAVWTPDELQAFLEEFRTVRPDLSAAWSVVVRHAMGRNDLTRALTTAEQATEHFPLVAAAWFDLARAREANADLPGTIEALRRALRIQPAWREAVRLLAQVQLRTGHRDQALAELRREFPTDPSDPDHDAQVALQFWAAGCREEALARLQKVLRTQPGSGQGWKTLRSWSAELKHDGLAEGLAREIVAECPDDPYAWLGLALVLRESGEFTGGITAVRRALDLAPREIAAHELNAELLALDGRFEQSLTACSPLIWGDSPPLQLSARKAWILWLRGHRHQAIRAMRDLVWRNLSYLWAWKQLVGWYIDISDDEGYAEASKRWAWLEPQNPWAHFHRGQALLRWGLREEAKLALRRATELAPQFDTAAGLLFDVELEDKELKAAEAVLESNRAGSPPHLVLTRRVRLLCASGERMPAVQAFGDLCLLPDADWEALASAGDAMIAAKLRDAVVLALERAQEAPIFSPWAAAVWIKLIFVSESDLPRCLDALRKLTGMSEAWELGSCELVGRLGQLKAGKSLRDFVKEHWDRLRSKDRTWFSVLDVLIRWADYSLAREWVRGWDSRGTLWPDAYWRISLASRGCGDDAEAARVVRFATNDLHLKHPALWTWALFDATLHSEEGAARHMKDLEGCELEPLNAFLVLLARGMLSMEPGPEGIPKKGFENARRRIQEAAQRYPQYRSDAIHRHAFKQAVYKIAGARGGWHASLWRAWWTPRRTH